MRWFRRKCAHDDDRIWHVMETPQGALDIHLCCVPCGAAISVHRFEMWGEEGTDD